ncbi:MAG: DUF968 domain-containing protein [Chloroflexota bacterium]
MKYKDYVRTLPCCVSGLTGESIDPHHIIGSRWLTGKGMAKKGSDLTCIPLCHELHMELHNGGWRSFEEKHNMCQVEMMVQTILQAEKDGIIRG